MLTRDPQMYLQGPGITDRLETRVTATIREAMEEATTPAYPPRLPSIPPRTRALMERKRRIRSDWQRTRDPALKTQLNQLVEQILEALVESAADS